MSKNILPDIAKLLGVEINEEFGVRVTEQPIIQGGFDVCITEHNIVYRNKRDVNGIWQPLESDTIYDLFNGSLEIVRKPYKPKLRDKYWSYSGQAFNVVCFNWSILCKLRFKLLLDFW